MNAFDFSKEVVNVCSRYPFIQEIEIQLLDEPVAKIKAVLGNDVFFKIIEPEFTMSEVEYEAVESRQ